MKPGTVHTGLRVAHWAMEGRSGLTFKAESIVAARAGATSGAATGAGA